LASLGSSPPSKNAWYMFSGRPTKGHLGIFLHLSPPAPPPQPPLSNPGLKLPGMSGSKPMSPPDSPSPFFPSPPFLPLVDYLVPASYITLFFFSCGNRFSPACFGSFPPPVPEPFFLRFRGRPMFCFWEPVCSVSSSFPIHLYKTGLFRCLGNPCSPFARQTIFLFDSLFLTFRAPIFIVLAQYSPNPTQPSRR